MSEAGGPSLPAARIDRGSIEATWAAIQPWVRVTPVVQVSGTDFGLDRFPLVLKLEHLQHAGSFKTRGAFANLLMREIPGVGVVAASGGNHGAAVAYAAMRRGVPAKIFVPTVASPVKIQRIREYGAELVISGDGSRTRWRPATCGWRSPARCRSTRSTSARRCSVKARSAWS